MKRRVTKSPRHERLVAALDNVCAGLAGRRRARAIDISEPTYINIVTHGGTPTEITAEKFAQVCGVPKEELFDNWIPRKRAKHNERSKR